jgi:hypothetical protein
MERDYPILCQAGAEMIQSKTQDHGSSVKKRFVVGPDGEPLTVLSLPPANTLRWVPRRKAVVVAAVRGGLITLDEAMHRYNLTAEEFLTWEHSLQVGGLTALRVKSARNRWDRHS